MTVSVFVCVVFALSNCTIYGGDERMTKRDSARNEIVHRPMILRPEVVVPKTRRQGMGE